MIIRTKDLPTYSGKAMAWFDQPGGSTQYQFTEGRGIQALIKEGYLSKDKKK